MESHAQYRETLGTRLKKPSRHAWPTSRSPLFRSFVTCNSRASHGNMSLFLPMCVCVCLICIMNGASSAFEVSAAPWCWAFVLSSDTVSLSHYAHATKTCDSRNLYVVTYQFSVLPVCQHFLFVSYLYVSIRFLYVSAEHVASMPAAF